MKKLVYLMALAMIFTLFSCGGSKKDKGSAEDKTETEKTKADEKIADCDDFLKRYEEWMNEYVEVIEAVFAGTDKEEGLEERWEALVQEAATWSTQWLSLIHISEPTRPY